MKDRRPSPFGDQNRNIARASPPPPSMLGGVPPGYVAHEPTAARPVSAPVASAGNRIVARVIDGLILAVPLIVVGVTLGGGKTFDLFGGVSFSDILLVQLASLVLSIGYEVAFLATRGATPGKMVMSVKVVYEDHRPLDLEGAVKRLSTKIGFGLMAAVPALVGTANLGDFVVFVVSVAFLFTDGRRRTVWDRIAKTVVVDS